MKEYTFNQLSKKIQKSLHEYYCDCIVERKASMKECIEYYMTSAGEGNAILFDTKGNELD